FLNGLTEKMYEFRNGEIKEHLGGITEFMNKLKVNRLNDMNAKSPFIKPKEEPKIEQPKTVDSNNELEKELKQLKNQVSKSEGEIARLEAAIKIVDDQLSDPAQYQTIINNKETFAKYEQMKKQLDNEMSNWESLQAKLEDKLKK
ncbi:MAG: hypothetical protein WBM13_00540, partial [Bacteroidia bacterium]